jgi:DNA-binding NarL/FixJ family response regulator
MVNGTEKQRYGILIVDDHPLVREGLTQIIKRQSELFCCGEASSVSSVRLAIVALKPSLITLDLRLPDGDGLELIENLTLEHPSIPILVISQCDEMLYAERALKAGARGYVMKERGTDEILTAIRAILSGQLFVSPKINALALQQMVGSKTKEPRNGLTNLTDRELQVLQLLGAGIKTREVAVRLNLSIKTVETHRENIKHKLGIPDAASLVRYAANWVEGRNLRPHSSQGNSHTT